MIHQGDYNRRLRLFASLVTDQRSALERRQPLATLEKVQLDHERASYDRSPKPLRQLDCRMSRTACRQKIVRDQHALAARQRVFVNLERSGSVFEFVALLERTKWQLARLAGDREADAKPVCDRRTDNEPA